MHFLCEMHFNQQADMEGNVCLVFHRRKHLGAAARLTPNPKPSLGPLDADSGMRVPLR